MFIGEDRTRWYDGIKGEGMGAMIGFVIATAGVVALAIAISQFNRYPLKPSTQLSSSPFEINTTFNSSPTNNATSHFQSEPKYRGTVGIITTCLTTLGLCVWTALHLNLPEPEVVAEDEEEEDKGNMFMRRLRKVGTALHPYHPELEAAKDEEKKVKGNIFMRSLKKVERRIARFYWVLVGIFIPEFVAFTAWTQFLSAGRFNKEMLELLGQEDNSEKSSKKKKRRSKGRGRSSDDHTENLLVQNGRSSTDTEMVVSTIHLRT
jgi:hypothetical protein